MNTIRAIPASPMCVVRGDGYPCAGGSWSQLSVGLLNHRVKARTPAFLWVIGLAVTGEKGYGCLGPNLGSGAARL